MAFKFKMPDLFQDVDGGSSMKRVVFFISIILVAILALAPLFWHHFDVKVDQKILDYGAGALDKVIGLAKWIGAFIVAEHGPQAIASWKGTQTAKASPDELPQPGAGQN